MFRPSISTVSIRMTKLLRTAALLALGAMSTAALAAGGTSTTTTTTPRVIPKVVATTPRTPPATIPAKKPIAVAKKATATTTIIVDLWAKRWGDLGPAYLVAVKLAQDAKYEPAITAFNGLNKPDDPRVLNWIGFSLRKLGKVDEALPYYDKALSKAPDFTPAHEYLGEAYVQMKDVNKAKEQLAQIEKLCGNQTCEEFKDLSQAIAKVAL